jgi:hypothetical protein
MSNTFPGLAPEEAEATKEGPDNKTLLKSPTTPLVAVHEMPSADDATAVGDPHAVHNKPFHLTSVALFTKS